MQKVGLTGNMGSGKSVVARIFCALGVPVYYADTSARRFLETEKVIDQLTKHFGHEIITAGQPDRKKIASIVFGDDHALQFLNSLIHPLVRADLQDWFKANTQYPIVIYEAAILFESGFYVEFDKIITVSAPIELIYKRLKERDNTDKNEVAKRMRHQWPQKKKAALSDFEIINDERRMIIPQVISIHKNLTDIQNGHW